MRTRSHFTLFMSASAAAALTALAMPAQAQQLADAYTFKNLAYSQSGPSGSVIIPTGTFFNAGADLQNPGDFDSVTVTYPGSGGPQALPQIGPTSFGIGPSFPNQAAMDAAFPFGAYIITATNSGTLATDTETLNYTADAYAGNIPALTGASYDALQGLHTSSPSLTLNFNTQDANPLATSSFTFLTIFNSPLSCDFLAASATSCTVDPQDLLPGTTYTYELDFSNRIETSASGVLDGVDFEVRTDGTFTTAIPEPSTWAMMWLGLGGLGAALRLRRRNLMSMAVVH
jgi:hypothetical protein